MDNVSYVDNSAWTPPAMWPSWKLPCNTNQYPTSTQHARQWPLMSLSDTLQYVRSPHYKARLIKADKTQCPSTSWSPAILNTNTQQQKPTHSSPAATPAPTSTPCGSCSCLRNESPHKTVSTVMAFTPGQLPSWRGSLEGEWCVRDSMRPFTRCQLVCAHVSLCDIPFIAITITAFLQQTTHPPTDHGFS